MKAIQFNELLEGRITQMRSTLKAKASEYATEADRLHNFKRMAALRTEGNGSVAVLPSDTLLGNLVKHWVSVEDLVATHARGCHVDPALIDEKLGDAINYLFLLEAVLKERPQ